MDQAVFEQISIPVGDVLSLAQTLDCGQCFRWKWEEGAWQGVVGDKVLQLKEDRGNLLARCLSHPQIPAGELEHLIREYLDLDPESPAIRALCSAHPVLKDAVDFAGGIHILRQDPWEALCTFILSQNNNIKRITGLVERLCESFGNPIPAEGKKVWFSFPPPEVLASLSAEDLAPVRCGFRAKYVLDAARRVASGEIDLNNLEHLPTPQAMEKIMTIKGVGPKVAQCALLFGMHKLDCLPRDVWIGRAMDALFPGGFPEEVLPVAGAAQQYLFHYVRLRPEVLEV